MISQPARSLTEEALDHIADELRRKGFARIRDVIPAHLREELAGALQSPPSEKRLTAVRQPDGTLASIHGLQHALPALVGYARETPLRRLVTRLFGESVSDEIPEASYFRKSPRLSTPSPAHQDNSFLRAGRPHGLTFWIPLDDVDEDAAPLLYYEHSHGAGTYAHLAEEGNALGLAPGVLDELGEPVAVPCRAGDCLVHHIETVHASAPNRSPRTRHAISFVLLSTDAGRSRGEASKPR